MRVGFFRVPPRREESVKAEKVQTFGLIGRCSIHLSYIPLRSGRQELNLRHACRLLPCSPLAGGESVRAGEVQTSGLEGRCSTAELRPHVRLSFQVVSRFTLRLGRQESNLQMLVGSVRVPPW